MSKVYILRKYRLLVMFVVCIGEVIIQFDSFAIGVRAHIEIGIEAIKKYILEWEEQYPPIAELFKNEDVYPAFYAGCAFPDWGYGGINPDASEASHWNKFMSSYAEVLKKKRKIIPPSEFRKEMAFFLGMIVHNISDIPWHFDDDQNKSFITSARENGGTSHQNSEMATDIFLFVEKELPYPIVLPLYWPYDTIMETFRRCGINVTIEQLKAGCTREQAYLASGPLIAMAGYQKLKAEHKWVYEHYHDYYYGGLSHCASAVSSFMKYYYALITDDFVLQETPDYSPYVRKNNDYIPLKGIELMTLGADSPSPTTEEGNYFILSNEKGDVKDVILRLRIPKNMSGFTDANLWIYLAEVEYHNSQKDSAPILIADVTEILPLPKDSEGRFNEIGISSLVQLKEFGEKVLIYDAIPLKIGWVKVNLSKYLERWSERDINECVIYISLVGSEEFALKFYSSEAFKKEGDIYCGGNLIAYRPIFIATKK